MNSPKASGSCPFQASSTIRTTTSLFSFADMLRPPRCLRNELYQPVAVEKDVIARLEHYLLLLVTHPRHEPKRHPPSPELLGIPTTPQVGQIVPCVGVAQETTLWVEYGVEAGDEHV